MTGKMKDKGPTVMRIPSEGPRYPVESADARRSCLCDHNSLLCVAYDRSYECKHRERKMATLLLKRELED